MTDGGLHISLLGELRLTYRDGRATRLPASKKTRALLGYLIATGQPHRRERLCQLFWDGPDDPRAELRWSLTKLRPVLNETNAIRLTGDREHVAFEPCGAELDVTALRQLRGTNLATAPLSALQAAAALSHGEFLDGLDLPACYRYQAWCLAERETLSALRLNALSALIARLADQPADALSYARALVAADPLSISGHCAVMRLLDTLGRRHEALEHYEHTLLLLETEVGAAASKELSDAGRALQSNVPAVDKRERARTTAPLPIEVPSRSVKSEAAFVGRLSERAVIDQLVADAGRHEGCRVLHVTGAAGIGKSHLLDRLRGRMEQIGARAFGGRAFEAESTRPYGIWTDIFAPLAHEPDAALSIEQLGLLTAEHASTSQGAADRARLLARIAEVLGQLAADRPVLIVLDDLHWVDDASAALFHYLARTCGPTSAILLACATRAGELDDNPAVANALASLRREGKLLEVPLAPLTRDDTAALIRAVNSNLDPARAFVESDGNPLFILELARAHASDAANPQRTLEAVIDRELSRLSAAGRELLMWAAALGRSFDVHVLAALAGQSAQVLTGLRELERREVLHPAGEGAYDFVHDIVRQVAYRNTSQPRRKLLHARIARHLGSLAEADDNLASTVARHAALSNEHEIAVRACVLAGERCLRLFANAEAKSFAERGLWHLDQCSAGRAQADHRIALHKIQILATAGPAMRPLPSVTDELTRAIAAAEAFGLHQAVMTGHYLLSVIHQEAGQNQLARQSTLLAVRAGRGADNAAYLHQLANTARCLLELEAEIPRARLLLREAQTLAEPLGLRYCEIEWGRGLMQRWDGELELAAQSMKGALELACGAADRWREYKCLTWLATIELERGDAAAARAHCAELLQVARKLGDAEVPLAMTLDALAQLASGEERDDHRLVSALQQLRTIDDKSHLAYALNAAATLALDMERIEAAHLYASEALSIAAAMQRTNDRAIAHATLRRLRPSAAAQTDPPGDHCDPPSFDERDLSKRARSALGEAMQAGHHRAEPLQR